MTSLHSTMVLLIPSLRNPIRQNIRFLHSTMFLLILKPPDDLDYKMLSLHSTMFLLIQLAEISAESGKIFTFHNISINTRFTVKQIIPVLSLHSTMFLLILSPTENGSSIGSTLHSTMFLLIRTETSADNP